MWLCRHPSRSAKRLLVIVVLIVCTTISFTRRGLPGNVENSIILPHAPKSTLEALNQVVGDTNSSTLCVTGDGKPNPVLTDCLIQAIHSVPDEAMPNKLRMFKPYFSKDEHKTLLELLEVFHQLMTSHNLTYFLHSGTLLGSWRHHGFVPWDDDADVFVAVTDVPKLKVLCLQNFLQMFYWIYSIFYMIYYIISYHISLYIMLYWPLLSRCTLC